MRKNLISLYFDGDNCHFMDGKTFEQVEISKKLAGEQHKLLKENLEVTISFMEETPISIELPTNIECIIETTDAAIKNQTASSSYKPALLDCGLKVNVPPFIESGEKIVIDTRTLEYVKKIKLMSLNSPKINLMTKTCLKASRSLIRDFGEIENLQVSSKGPGDFVTSADKRTEKIIIEELQKAHPEFCIITEESGIINKSNNKNKWIIDPIDGTLNFLNGIPQFAISIAYEENDEGIMWNYIQSYYK